MLARLSLCLLVAVSLCYGQATSGDRQCLPDNVDFAEKVEKSSVVVYGKAMAKIMNDGSESVFHVFYQVDCILKGPATLRQINITNAGKRSPVGIQKRDADKTLLFQAASPARSTARSSRSVAVTPLPFSSRARRRKKTSRHTFRLTSPKSAKKETPRVNCSLAPAISIASYHDNRSLRSRTFARRSARTPSASKWSAAQFRR